MGNYIQYSLIHMAGRRADAKAIERTSEMLINQSAIKLTTRIANHVSIEHGFIC